MSTIPAVVAPPAATAGRRSPYQGLVPFGEEDAAWFFGRDEWCDIVCDNLLAYRLTVLYGASGVGKSSILEAGVVRRLREDAHQEIEERRAADEAPTPDNVVVPFGTWSGDDPLADLANAIRDAAAQLAPAPVAEPSAEHLDDLIAAWSDLLDAQLLIILDQFEEYFLYRPREDAKGSFDDELCRALRRVDLPAHFLISIREDTLAKLDRLERRVPALLDHLLRVERLDRDAAREAIELPVARWSELELATGHDFEVEPDLVEAVLDEVEAGKVVVGTSGEGRAVDSGTRGTQGIDAPYLQLVMTRLWDEESRAGSRTLRLATFRRLGGAESIVRTHLDTALETLAPAERDVAGRILRHLVTPSGTKIALTASDLAAYAELDEARIAPVLHELAGDPRILKPTAESRYEIYHDALAAPILDWQSRWREQARRRRERRRLALLIAAGLVAAALALLFVWLYLRASAAEESAADNLKAAVIARRESNEQATIARRQARLARSRELAAKASAQLAVDPNASLRLAVEAEEEAPTSEAHEVLARAIGQSRLAMVLAGHTDTVESVEFSPDGKLIASEAIGDFRFWRADTGAQLANFGGVYAFAFSPDGKRQATTDGSKIHVWNADTGAEIATLPEPADDVTEVAFSPNGRRIATVGGYTAIVWDVATRARLTTIHGRAVTDRVAFSPDGKRIVTGSSDGIARVWDAATGDKVADLRGGISVIWAVAFSPDGKRIATASADLTARVWNAVTGDEIATLRGHTEDVFERGVQPRRQTHRHRQRRRDGAGVGRRDRRGAPRPQGHTDAVYASRSAPTANASSPGAATRLSASGTSPTTSSPRFAGTETRSRRSRSALTAHASLPPAATRPPSSGTQPRAPSSPPSVATEDGSRRLRSAPTASVWPPQPETARGSGTPPPAPGSPP